MDFVASKLQEWGFPSLIENFQAHGIDEEALLLLDKESIRTLVPQIGPSLKLQKKILDYKKTQEQEIITEVIHPGNETVYKIQNSFKVESCVPNEPAQPSDISISDNIQTSVTKFEVLNTIMDKCEEIGKILQSGNPISYLEKLKLSRVVVKNCLIKKCGVFPSTQQKEQLAKELINAFPPLKGVDGTGYEQWFCKGVKNKLGKTTPNRGHLEENLRNWRQRLSSKDKQKYGIRINNNNKGTKRALSTTTFQDVDLSVDSLEKQQWLKENSAPAATVLQYMRETCLERRNHIISTSPSISQILEQWPKLLRIDMIDQEFAQIYSQEECGSLCKEFALIARSLLLQAKNCGRTAAETKADSLSDEIGELPDADQLIVSTAEVNAALILLPYLLPQGVVNKKKKFRPTLDQTRRHFIDELPEGSNIADILNNRTEEDRTRTQPFVVITGNTFSPSEIYVVLEGSAIQIDSLLKAVDICFKIHFVFNLEYSAACENVYTFLNSSFYKIEDFKYDTPPMPSCVKELRSRIFVRQEYFYIL